MPIVRMVVMVMLVVVVVLIIVMIVHLVGPRVRIRVVVVVIVAKSDAVQGNGALGQSLMSVVRRLEVAKGIFKIERVVMHIRAEVLNDASKVSGSGIDLHARWAMDASELRRTLP